jgi:hypothetical protein
MNFSAPFALVKEWGRRSVSYAYRRGLRPFIPFREPVLYAGIPIYNDRPWGDRFFPAWLLPNDAPRDYPHYESALIAGLRETVQPNDTIVIVGAGIGVTAVSAARFTKSGIVQCYEGGGKRVKLARETIRRNRVSVTVHYAVVGKPIAVFDDDIGPILHPSQLPECDVLEMDCEGAEVDILREMVIRPRAILVETHGYLDAPSHLVASLLEQRGYSVSDKGLAEPHRSALCIQNDTRVLLGTRTSRLAATACCRAGSCHGL